MEREKNILDHLSVLVRWRRLILAAFFTVTLVTAGISLILPKAYRARAVVYPPRERQESFGLSALLGNLPMGLLGVAESAVTATEFVPILQSQRVAEAIARRFDLKAHYGTETREQLLDIIAGRLEIDLSREQFLTVSYEAETPDRAAEITNAFVEELDRALRERREQQAGELRHYLEKRLARAEREMVEAELAYNAFQKKNMAIDLETQARAQLESASTLYSTLAELMIKREVAARLMEPGNPKLQQLDIEIEGTTETVERILMGQDSSGNGSPNPHPAFPEVFIPFRRMPALGLQALQLMRDMEIRSAIYQFVLQEYEKSRFEEEKETSLVVVLDRAVPPDARSRPRRTFMVTVAGGLSLLLSALLAFVFESLHGLEDEDRRKLDGILRDLRLKRSD